MSLLGERLRVQTPWFLFCPPGACRRAAFAIVAQSLPYSADVHKLPFALPAGYSAVVAAPPTQLAAVEDPLTQVSYYLGPLIEHAGPGRRACSIGRLDLSNHMGKYVVKLGHRWPLHWTWMGAASD
jgi:hypothetical protein